MGLCSHLYLGCIKPSNWHTVGVLQVLAELHYWHQRLKVWLEREAFGGRDKAQLWLLLNTSIANGTKSISINIQHLHKTGNCQVSLVLQRQEGRQCYNARDWLSSVSQEFISPVTPNDSDILEWIPEETANPQ